MQFAFLFASLQRVLFLDGGRERVLPSLRNLLVEIDSDQHRIAPTFKRLNLHSSAVIAQPRKNRVEEGRGP